MDGPEVICTGQALVDCIFSGGDLAAGMVERIRLAPGGDAYNEAVWLSRLGRRAALYCPLADDAGAAVLRQGAAAGGVDLRLCVPGRETPVSGLFVEKDGERRSVLSKAHSLPGFVPDGARVAASGVVTMASLFRAPFDRPGETLDFLQKACRNGAKVYGDVKLPKGGIQRLVDYRAVLPLLDFIAPNAAEARYYSGGGTALEMGRRFLEWGAKCVLLKLGRRGCLVLDGDRIFHVPAYAVQVADGVGAGDAFAAGLICGLLEGKDLPACCELGTACAALCVGSPGATGGACSRADLAAFLENPPVPRLPRLALSELDAALG